MIWAMHGCVFLPTIEQPTEQHRGQLGLNKRVTYSPNYLLNINLLTVPIAKLVGLM